MVVKINILDLSGIVDFLALFCQGNNIQIHWE